MAKVGEFLVVSAVSSCVLSLSKGLSGFPFGSCRCNLQIISRLE